MASKPTVLFWFRNDLRIQDNTALRLVHTSKANWVAIHIIDRDLSPVQDTFQTECLSTLSQALGKNHLHLFQSKHPYRLVKRLLKKYEIDTIAFNHDPEYHARDQKHLLDRYETISAKGNDLLADWYDAPSSFTKARTWVLQNRCSPICGMRTLACQSVPALRKETEAITLAAVSVDLRKEAWKILRQFMPKIPSFSKPETSPNALVPDTSTMSRYLARGVIGVRELWKKVADKSPDLANDQRSFLGQLIWREYYRLLAYSDPCFDQQAGNQFSKDYHYSYQKGPAFKAWKYGKTGYPFVDAIMHQLRQEGWIHHLARHMVACFLTRGDLYLHWELGRLVFDEWLIDRDYAMNAGNWMWVSASAFFHQYYRIYSPITFGKKTDPSGEYIRKYLPILQGFPDQYIYQPWEAPLAIQQEAGCIIGKDYPKPIIDHAVASKRNIAKMKQAR